MTGHSPEPEDPRLDALVEEFLERTERGEAAEAAVHALCAGQPDLAERLKLRVELLRRVGLLSAAPSVDPPERLGEFRILSRLGGGGMGVVYLAEQERLGRVVALKVIHPAQLHVRRARERFLREVRTVARLQHPGIVPVHAVGEQDGVPYFAMERVPGCTLDEALQEVRAGSPAQDAPRDGGDLLHAVGRRAADGQPGDDAPASAVFAGTWEQACLRIVRQVADTLHHVHQRGIVHRDVKPSNVMLTRDGRALLLDFGLAGSAEAATLTAAGSPLGSLPYMSPEQAHGALERIDARSDVYSLGVTLYELLTLRRAFDGTSAAGVVADIEQGRRTPPRQIDPRLSWEAETVCLTAMDPDPRRRYATAGDFARDLFHVLERRPIAARRAGPWLRARRWTQRRPAAAVALAAGVLLVVGGPTLLALQQRRHNVRLQSQQAATLASLRQALQALDSLTKLGGNELQDIPQMEPVRARLLDEARALSDSLMVLAADQPTVLAEAFDLQIQVAELHLQQGQAEASREAGLAALGLAQRLGDMATKAARASAHAVTGRALQELGRFDEAAVQYREAITMLEEQAEPPASAVLRRAKYWLALVEIQQHVSLADAEQAGRTALALLDGLADAEAPMWRAIGLDHLASTLQLQGRTDEALPCSRSAVEGLEAACAANPSGLEARTGLMTALGNQALVFSAAGKREESMAALRRAIEVCTRLAADFPANTLYAYSLAKSASTLGNQLAHAGRIDEALAELARARELLVTLSDAHPESASYAQDLATVCVNSSLMRLGSPSPDLPAIRALSDEAVARSEALVAREPDVGKHEHLLSNALVSRGGVQRAEGDLAGARRTLEAALDHGRRAIELQPDRRSFRMGQVELFGAFGDVLDSLGDREALAAAAEDMRATMPDDPKVCVRAAQLLVLAEDPRVIEWLREAVDRGFPAAALARDPAFAELQSNADFQALLEARKPQP